MTGLRIRLGPWLAVLFLLASASPAWAQSDEPPVPQEFDWWEERGVPATTPWGQEVDTTATRMMLSWTTEPEFTNRHVDHLPYDPQVVSPMDHFGYPMGKPGDLHRVDELYGYYEALAGSSPRVEMEYLQETEEGNRFALVKVGSEENLARLDEIREGYQRLTEPRETTDEEMESLVSDLPVIHMVFSGLHSAETGHPEVTPELAYRVAVSDDPMIRNIRENAVLFIMPATDPDGRNRVVDWYRYHMDMILERFDRIPGPPFWGKYIRHDNNRDGLQMTLRLSEQVLDLFEEWKYPIAIDLHESVPFLYVSTGTGPYNPHVDPVTRHEWQWISHYEVTSLTSLGMPGVWTHDFFDGWNPGYMVFVLNNRNAIGRFYETFNHSVPLTLEQEVSPGRTTVEWFRANPPYPEVIWSLRNNINYAQTGVLHSLELMANNRETVLRNYWTKGVNAVTAGLERAPHAYRIPADQARKADVSHMLNLLQRHGIELHRADAGGSFGGVEVQAGDYLIRMDQPYRNFIESLMSIQDFPEHAPTPYDDVAWTFPLLYNVTVEVVDEPEVLDLPAVKLEEPVLLAGRVEARAGNPDWWVVRYEASSHALQARHELEDVPFYAAREPFRVAGGEEFGAGAWLIPGADVSRDRLEDWAESFGLDVVSATEGEVGDVPRHRQNFPRIALLHTWRNTQDDGAIRYAFDTMGIPYTYFPEDRLAEGDLRESFDVILFPEQGRGATGRQIFEGLDPEDGPLDYPETDEYPSLGYPASTDDMTGGMGYEGLAALRDFVREGGTLVTLGSATRLPLDFGFVRGVSERSTEDLFSPGSIVRAEVDNGDHPVTYGYDRSFPAFDRFGPYLSVSEALEPNVVVRYADADEVFESGLVLGRDEMGGHPAIVSVPKGEGHVVLFGLRVLHRNQTQGSFALAWNAILNWNELGVGIDTEAAAADEVEVMQEP